MQLTTLFDLASRLRIDGALPLFLLYTFMPVCFTAYTMLPFGVIVHINFFVYFLYNIIQDIKKSVTVWFFVHSVLI